MTPAELREGLARLTKRFGVDLSDHMVRRYATQFESLSASDWFTAVTFCERQASEFPEPSYFWRFVPHPAWSRGQPAVEQQHARESMKMITAIMNGRLRGEMRGGVLRSMATKYPGVEWEDAASWCPRPEREPGEDDAA